MEKKKKLAATVLPKLPTKTHLAVYLPQHDPGRAHSDG